MKVLSVFISCFILSVGLPKMLPTDAYGQLWVQFAHPGNPHPGVNGDITTPALFADPSAVVQQPALVILVDWSDVTHRVWHDVAFWRDLVFGAPRPGTRSSLAEIFRENSNGRLLLVPATAGDVYDGASDGVVGWVASQWVADPTQHTPEQGRAEAIRVADPFFDYYRYDGNSDGLVTGRELVILFVWAQDARCDHVGHFNDPNWPGHSGGRVRGTDPGQVPVDQDKLANMNVAQAVAGVAEGADVGLVTHELGHSAVGLGDLYQINPGACTTYQQVTDGYLCDGTWYPPGPGPYSFMDASAADRIPHVDPWAKIHLGFVKPLVVTHDGTYTLHDAEADRSFSTQATQPEAIIIHDPLRADPYKEYFILENRNQAMLNDQGLAVWLINEDVPNWPTGLNTRKGVRLIRRSGHFVGAGVSLWDGINDTDGYDLTATSTPRNTNWTDGTKSYVEIYDISQAGPAMTFKVRMPPIFVDWDNLPSEYGTQDFPFDEVDEAIAAIPETPRTIRIAGGSYPGPLVINTPCTLKGWRNGNAIIGQ
jgi:M6 family metalloprotease-like protein